MPGWPNTKGSYVKNPWVRLESVKTLNPVTFLLIAAGAPEHGYLEVLVEVYSSWPDLTDKPLQNPDFILYMDNSSFMSESKRYAGYAIVSDSETLGARVFPGEWSSQTAGLWALVQALEFSKNKQINIYIDLHYAFVTLHYMEMLPYIQGKMTLYARSKMNKKKTK